MMELLTADYVALIIALAGAVIGLFIGFSGALAFFCGSSAAAASATFVFPLLAGEIANVWVRGILVGVGALLVFGLVRLIVRKLVHGILAQPGDAIFGSLIAALTSFLVALAIVALLGFVTGEAIFKSSLLTEIVRLVGGRLP